MFVEVLFADESVAAAGDAGVGGEHDDGVFCSGGSVERVEHAADEQVEVGNVAVVVGEHRADVDRSARPREKLLVADGHLAVVEGMLREEIGGKRDLFGIVADGIVVRHDVGIVRAIEGEVGEERGGVFFP